MSKVINNNRPLTANELLHYYEWSDAYIIRIATLRGLSVDKVTSIISDLINKK